MWRKLIVIIQLYWIRILFISLSVALVLWIIQFMIVSNANYDQLESFTRRSISAQMGQSFIMFLFITLIQVPLSIGMYSWLMSGGALGKLSTVDLKKVKVNVRMDEVIGMEGPKREAKEIIKFLKDRDLLKAIGGKNLKGAIIVGPPGCGKTYLAKAIATECDLPFLSMVGSDFVGMFMGQGAARMKTLFKEARALAKMEGGCIIFIDEIDSFARPRTQDVGFGGSVSNNSTINQFLTELDGLRKTENNIVIIAATNVPPESLDSAIMRSGRFDRKIYVTKPSTKEREALLQFYLKKVTVEPGIDIAKLADKCQSFSPADISNMVREAAVLSIRHGHPKVTAEDLTEAMKDIITTLERMGEDKILGDKVNVKWDDLIGMDETKKDAWEIVELLRDRHKLKVVGGQIIKGVLLIGPPGCGKTYLAKAIATESGFPFMAATGSDFINKLYVGTGISKLQAVFKDARDLAKSEGGCIIFIDEIDAFVNPREPNPFESHKNDANYNSVINQFLTEIDGLKGENANITVIAATNMPEDKLDPAVTRSGRFDRKIYFRKPSSKEREALIKYYLAKVQFDNTINISLIAEKSRWFSPADINNMIREAGILALREKREIVSHTDLEEARKRVMASIEAVGQNKLIGERVKVSWDEVIGISQTKEEAWEAVKLLKDRNMLKATGGKIIKGMIMFGPPGCGKTYLAKAIATEVGFPFISVTCTEVVGIYVGEGARKIKDIFKEAREMAKAEGGCVIFFDEIDAFATPRKVAQDHGAAAMHNATINQFLTEVDGLRQDENNIFVLGATNVQEKDIDAAILRAGRLERKLYFHKPNLEDRKELFGFFLKKISSNPNLNINLLASMTVDLTPADIESMVREASLLALRENREMIELKDLTESYDRITMGILSNKKYNQKELIWTAYHEAGHAILTYLCHPTDDVVKATIRPRKNYLGYIYIRPIESLGIGAPDKEHLLAQIKISIAGFVAEKLVFGTTTNGVYGDFKSIMHLAQQMVWECGMGKSGLLGNLTSVTLSEKTKETLDADVQDILQTCLKETTEILTKHRDLLEEFTQELLKKGDLQHDEIKAIFQKFGLTPASRESA